MLKEVLKYCTEKYWNRIGIASFLYFQYRPSLKAE